MPTNTNTDATQVAVGSGKVTGAIFIAPTTVELPTDATTALGEGFKCIGFTSDAGPTLSESSTTKSLRVWEGLAEVRTLKSERTEQIKFTPVQLNETVLKAMWGEDNVSVDTETGAIAVSHHGETLEPVHMVIEMVPFASAVQRLCFKGQLTNIGDATYNGTDFEGRELTFNCLALGDGKTMHEYTAHVE